MIMNRNTARILSIVCVVASVAMFLYGMSFYYIHLPSTPAPEIGRIYPLNNHGYYTFMTHREYLEHEISTNLCILPFVIAVLIDYFYDPFDRRARGY